MIAERPRKNVHRLRHSMAIVSSSTNDAISLYSAFRMEKAVKGLRHSISAQQEWG